MMISLFGLIRRCSTLLTLSIFLLCSTLTVHANSAGSLTGVVRDQKGKLCPGLLISLVDLVARNTIPLLITTDEVGQINARNVTAGSYQIIVKSSTYQEPFDRFVEILPGKTAVLSLVVHQILGLGYEGLSAASISSLLRGSGNHRMIFRGVSNENIPEESSKPFFDEAVFDVYTSAGFGDDRLVFPSNASHGITTNFGVRDKLPDGTEYIFAGQFNSGNDSLFRVKNWLNYNLGENHELRFLMGYGRISFTEPSLSLLDNPSLISSETSYLKDAAITKILTLGFEDRWQLAPSLAFMWGAEINQVRRRSNSYFVSPNAAITYQPTESTTLRMSLSSKRETLSNSIDLPGGERLQLNDSIRFSNIHNQVSIGTARHYEASISQQLSDKTKLQVAVFDSLLLGTTPHVLNRLQHFEKYELLNLSAFHSETKGYRLTINHHLKENLRTSISYTQGIAPSIDPLSHQHIFVEASSLGALFRKRGFHALAAKVEAYIPQSETKLTAIIKTVPFGNPIIGIDPITDIYETPNSGINLFFRQLIPIPIFLVKFLGLDFLKQYKLEALIDIRNLLNEDLGLLPGAKQNLILVQQPRSLRGGLAVSF